MLHLFAWGFRVSSMKIRQFQAGREWGEQIEKKKKPEKLCEGWRERAYLHRPRAWHRLNKKA